MLKPIKSKEEHSTFLARAYNLMQLELVPNSKEADELEVISILIEAFEKENFPIEAPNPIEAILFRLDQLGMTSSDLSKLLGSRSRTSEILKGKRKLPKTHWMTTVKKLKLTKNDRQAFLQSLWDEQGYK